MNVKVSDGLSVTEVLFLICQSFTIVILSFIHPWMRPEIDDRVRIKMRKSVILNLLFVFCFAFSYTSKFYQSLIITALFYYLKMMLVRVYSAKA